MKHILIAIMILTANLAFADNVIKPKTVEDLKKTSVRILNLEMNSGGTGSIFRSFNNATHILTNKHICRLIEPGGIVEYKGVTHLVTHYKKFKDHDLCLIRIEGSLGVSLVLADELAKESSKSIVSGHPNLLPHIATVGHLSERTDIELMVGTKKCTAQDIIDSPVECAWFGGLPVVKSFDSQLISNLIKPGNSGSAVFNGNGEIVGVVFAGNSRDFSYGYIVPQIYLLYFLQNAHRFDWVKVGTKVDDEGISGRIFNYKCDSVMLEFAKYNKIKDFCKTIKDNMIWSK